MQSFLAVPLRMKKRRILRICKLNQTTTTSSPTKSKSMPAKVNGRKHGKRPCVCENFIDIRSGIVCQKWYSRRRADLLHWEADDCRTRFRPVRRLLLELFLMDIFPCCLLWSIMGPCTPTRDESMQSMQNPQVLQSSTLAVSYHLVESRIFYASD